MTGFRNLYEVFDGRLALPAGEKTYYIPEPDEELGLWCTAFCTAGIAADQGIDMGGRKLPPLVLDDDEEKAMYVRLLGPVWGELAADGHGFTTQRLFALTALIWTGLGEDAAMTFWNSGGDPKASQPRRSRRGAPAAAPRIVSMPSTAGASTTPPAGSTNGTTRRRPRRRR